MSWTRNTFPMIVGFFLLLGLMLFSGGEQASDAEAAKPVAKPTVAKPMVAGANVAAKAELVGLIKFDGPRPRRGRIKMVADRGGSQDECARLHKTRPLAENVLISKDGELANVFVYVRKGLEKKDYPMPKKPVVLDQSKCMFRPRVQGIRVGQKLIMRNSDKLTHNVRSYAFRNRPFNVAQPGDSPERTKVFKRPERAIQLGCDIHKWMKAYVFAMEHPFFAVSNEKGQFQIKGLPAGDYTIAAWHEDFGEQKTKVTVAATGATKINFTFQAKKRD